MYIYLIILKPRRHRLKYILAFCFCLVLFLRKNSAHLIFVRFTNAEECVLERYYRSIVKFTFVLYRTNSTWVLLDHFYLDIHVPIFHKEFYTFQSYLGFLSTM
jgi:hypothetical protein